MRYRIKHTRVHMYHCSSLTSQDLSEIFCRESDFLVSCIKRNDGHVDIFAELLATEDPAFHGFEGAPVVVPGGSWWLFSP